MAYGLEWVRWKHIKTRDLATQIKEEADKFSRAAGYMSACAYGGKSYF